MLDPVLRGTPPQITPCDPCGLLRLMAASCSLFPEPRGWRGVVREPDVGAGLSTACDFGRGQH
eukprot:3336456-Amphidinium_carterae.1